MRREELARNDGFPDMNRPRDGEPSRGPWMWRSGRAARGGGRQLREAELVGLLFLVAAGGRLVERPLIVAGDRPDEGDEGREAADRDDGRAEGAEVEHWIGAPGAVPGACRAVV